MFAGGTERKHAIFTDDPKNQNIIPALKGIELDRIGYRIG